jgi:glycosyltransferase involved in cell wall biosynthesis
VVVIGRNEGDRLARCLESVRAAAYPADRRELIYVDSDSTDDSCRIAEGQGAQVIAIRPERPCAAAGRNAGMQAARYDLVQFLDGDTVLHADWLGRAVAAMADNAVTCVHGRVEEMNPEATIYNGWAHHDWYIPAGPTDFCGGIAMYRRSALIEVGGYDEALIAGEERDLSYRLIRDLGAQILCLDAPMVRHDIDMTRFGQYWRRCVRAGHAYAEVGSRHPGLTRWRRTCQRNFAHGLMGLTAVALSLAVRSWIPLAVWVGLLALAIGRQAWRHRRRIGTLRGAVGYAVHIYLSKVPTLVGHLDFFIRRWTGANPRKLIEHRGEPDRARCG